MDADSRASREADVIIVGGGVAGLTAAVGLSRRGVKVVLVERSQRLGGRAQSWTDPATGDGVDLGPHIMLTQYRNMLRLLDELGTSRKVVWQEPPRLILVDEPEPAVIRLRPLTAPLQFAPSLMAVPQVSWLDLLSNRRVLWQILRLTERRILELDGVDAETYLKRAGVSAKAIDWFWRSASMTIMNTPLENCSTGALLRFLRFLASRNDYRVGFAGEALEDLFAPGSARQITETGGQVLLGTEVAAIQTDDGTTVIGVQLKDGRCLRAGACIAAVPPRDLQELAPDGWSTRHDLFADLGKFESSPYICTYLWFDRKLTTEPFWTKVWAPDNLNYDFYDLSNIKPELARRPSLIAGNCMYSYESGELSDQEIVARTRAEIAQYLPEAASARVIHSRVHRVPMGIVRPSPGTERRRPGAATPIAGLYLAGDWTNTGLPSSMESAARSGWIAAERVLAAAGQDCRLAEPLPGPMGIAKLLAPRPSRE